jgi:excisionase family DNA binding protein
MSAAAIATTSIFEQYHATFAHHIIEQLKPLLESLIRPSTSIQQRLFDVEQAATYLGRSPEAVRLLIHRRRLPVTKIDGKVQIDRAALDKIISDATFYEC